MNVDDLALILTNPSSTTAARDAEDARHQANRVLAAATVRAMCPDAATILAMLDLEGVVAS